MLKDPRLAILNPSGLLSRARRAAVEAMFGGIYPSAVHVTPDLGEERGAR